MANLNLSVDYVNVPPEGIRLVEDTHAEWLRLDEAERAAALADPVEVAATRRQQGARAAGAWPSPPRATVDAQRPRSEEERQVGRSRLSSDSSGPSPYIDREEDIDEYTAASGGAVARRVRQRERARPTRTITMPRPRPRVR